jgi:hypothetical protein
MCHIPFSITHHSVTIATIKSFLAGHGNGTLFYCMGILHTTNCQNMFNIGTVVPKLLSFMLYNALILPNFSVLMVYVHLTKITKFGMFDLLLQRSRSLYWAESLYLSLLYHKY